MKVPRDNCIINESMKLMLTWNNKIFEFIGPIQTKHNIIYIKITTQQ